MHDCKGGYVRIEEVDRMPFEMNGTIALESFSGARC
jgi:hypothetical protein